MVNVINKMKANTRITEKESNRFLIYLSQLFRGTAFMPQIVCSEFLICAMTVVSLYIVSPTLIIVAIVFSTASVAFSMMDRSASTTFGPTTGSIWVYN